MITKYVLAEIAQLDIEEIFDFTVSEFGIGKAIEYHLNFIHLFEQLIEFPKEGKARDGIKKGLRSITKESHVVFYRILDDHVRIIRFCIIVKTIKANLKSSQRSFNSIINFLKLFLSNHIRRQYIHCVPKRSQGYPTIYKKLI